LLLIDRDGWVIDDKIKVVRRPNLRHGKMSAIHGIIVHQTGAATGQSTLDSYLHRGAAGAHFLIDKDGTIYQTGSVFWRQWHVGKLRARCLAEHRCTPVEIKMLSTAAVSKVNKYEAKKSVPQRYPSNKDAIGIELVSAVIGNGKDPLFEAATDAQNKALGWLIEQLRQKFSLPLTEVFRHPQVSYKDSHEAETARW
jgi:N-acetyl-anhydromuramyl-L-alanine amidase AmpD